MPVLNPDHLFDQADRLAAAPASGRPRQVDLRRAISSAYYGVFHFVMAALADEFVGVSQRSSNRYGLVYRSLDHWTLKDICGDIVKQTPPHRYTPYLPTDGFGADIQAFATATIGLQERRHRADYNPEPQFQTFEATFAIGSASLYVPLRQGTR